MPRTSSTTRTKPAAAPRVASTGRVYIDGWSTPIIPDAALDTTVQVGRLTFRAQYIIGAKTKPDHFFDVRLDRGKGAAPVDVISGDLKADLTPADVRALATALDRIATEIEREMPALHTEAARVATELRTLGLDIP